MDIFGMPPIRDGDVLGRIIILIIIYAVAIKSSNKKSKTNKAKRDWERLQREQSRGETAKMAARPAQRQAAKRSDARREDTHNHRSALERKPMATQLQMDLEQAGEGEDPCHDEIMPRGRELRPAQPGSRYTSVSQARLSAAGEGEDPCHDGIAEYDEGAGFGEEYVPDAASRETDHSVYDSPIFSGGDQNREALARQVLSGVIMSEVLTRPAERRMQRKMRRGA